MIVEKIIGKVEDFQQENLTIDRILLDHHDMGKPHQKLRSEAGETVAVSLPYGEHLFCGAVIYKDEKKLIAIDLLPEDALEIYPKGNLQWAKAAFNIGNMHHPAYLHEDCITIPYDPILENLIQGLGIGYRRCTRKLDGERVNHVIESHGHAHGHKE